MRHTGVDSRLAGANSPPSNDWLVVSTLRRIVLVQLPIPQPGIEPARGNVPLAAGLLALYARRQGLDAQYEIEIFPARLANRLADRGLVQAILAREPWMVGFTCYLWNIERSLWVAGQIERLRPEVRILLGGPEITRDNSWVLESPHVDFAVVGEGEQTFAELLAELVDHDLPRRPIPGLYVSLRAAVTAGIPPHSPIGAPAAGRPGLGTLPSPRAPLARLDDVSSPYLEGILDAAEEHMLLLETIRGCAYRCKFCYYPKSYDGLYFLSTEQIVATLEYARQRRVREVTLLDPTLNQRRDFAGFLRLLATCNPGHTFTYFGELRAEGIDAEIAALLRDANFTEVEIGLQSVEPVAQTLMDRRNNMRAFERGVRSMLDVGLRVKIDLIVGLPGDTPDSVRRSIRYVHDNGLYSDVQVFNLAVLPGTAFREEAAHHGLVYQPRPPYTVLRTPTMDFEDICALVAEAEETFETEFDALPAPTLEVDSLPGDALGLARIWRVDLDREGRDPLASPGRRAVGFTVWVRGDDLGAQADECARLARRVLDDNPHTTLQFVLEPTGDPHRVTPELLDTVLDSCYRTPTYLDRYYALAPGGVKGTKRLVVVVPAALRDQVGGAWVAAMGEGATLAWQGTLDESELDEHEYVLRE
jgi:radical SAM superfamily enzyme YgiQ (UPF0313 family)